jgi:hypothetical protein
MLALSAVVTDSRVIDKLDIVAVPSNLMACDCMVPDAPITPITIPLILHEVSASTSQLSAVMRIEVVELLRADLVLIVTNSPRLSYCNPGLDWSGTHY